MIIVDENKLDQWVKEAQEEADNLVNAQDRAAVTWNNINNKSIVFDVGAFKGAWSLRMARKYSPIIYAFEPQVWAYETCSKVLEDYNAQVFNFGLGKQMADGSEVYTLHMFGHDTHGCSFMRPKGSDIPSGDEWNMGSCRDIVKFMNDLNNPYIDLMMVNIEGYEFKLIPHMLDNGIMPARIIVQGHDAFGDWQELHTRLSDQYGRPIWSWGSTLTCWGVGL